MREVLDLLKVCFWVSAVVIIYVYAAYPVLLFVLSRHKKARILSEPVPLPTASLLISAYNERLVIADKLRNSLSLDYPPDLLQIIVISDCSNDGTDAIVEEFASEGVQLIRQTEHLGKSVGLNVGVAHSWGDILVFSDANALYQPDAIGQLVAHFSDVHVGYVVGNARYVDQKHSAPSAESEGLYWKLETWLKERESGFGSVVGGDGAIYAIRRELFAPLEPTDINDLLTPLQIIARGYRGVYEPTAVCFEEASNSFEKEFRRKVRIISRSLNALRRAPAVLLPWKQPRHWFALISHKVLRWCVPAFMLALLLATIGLCRLSFYQSLLWIQMACYGLAATGWAIQKRTNAPKVLYLAYYFCLVNYASLLGVIQFFRGSLSPTWQTIRQDGAAKPDPIERWVGK